MNLAEFARLTRRWAWLLLLCPLLAAGVAGAVSTKVPRVYQASATVLVKAAQPLDPGQAATGVTSTSDQIAATYADLMTQPVFLSRVNSELKLGWSTHTLGSEIKVTPQTTTTVLVVTVTDTNAHRASMIDNTLVNDFSTWQSEQAQQRLGPQIRSAQEQVNSLQGRVTADQQQISGLVTVSPQNQSTLSVLQQQLTTDSTELQTAQSNLEQLQSQAALASDSVIVVSPASVPNSPASPNVRLIVLLAAAGGLALGVVFVFVINRVDHSVKDDEELERRTGLMPLGHIPYVSPSKTRTGELVVLSGSPSASESYRSLRTNLQFASVDRPVKSIVVTSPAPGEGKSRTAANLAIVLALAGHTTLLLDANFRRPCIHRLFGIASKHGLAELILNEGPDKELIGAVPEVPGLWVLAAGASPPNPSEVLGSARMKALLDELAPRFDYVVLDTPSLNAVTDPALLAAQADATLLVIEEGRTDFRSLIRAKSQLDNVGAPVLGVVVNKLWPKAAKYRYPAYSSYRDVHVAASNGSSGSNGHREVAAANGSKGPESGEDVSIWRR